MSFKGCFLNRDSNLWRTILDVYRKACSTCKKIQKKALDAPHTELRDMFIKKSQIAQPFDDTVDENCAFNSASPLRKATHGDVLRTAPRHHSRDADILRVKSAPYLSNRTS